MRQQGSETAREKDSKGENEGGSEGVRQQGSETAREKAWEGGTQGGREGKRGEKIIINTKLGEFSV